MQWELSELDLQTVILLQFLDTPGDEVAPRSNEIREDFEHERLRHIGLHLFSELNRSIKAFQRHGAN